MLELLFPVNDALHAAGFAAAFLLTVVLIKLLGEKLPRDHGRKFAVEGALSEGKERGAGIIFVSVFAFVVCIFTKPTPEKCVYLLFILFEMVTGFLDDASDKPWKDYKKAICDLLTAAGITAVYIFENGTTIRFILTGSEVTLPVWLFAVISAVIIWLSINVTNCTDGVDGLSATLGIITLSSFSFLGVLPGVKGEWSYELTLFSACLMGYLLFNAHPSTVLMGDGGSRALGTLIAVAVLKNGDPLLWILFALIFILDGGLGLAKLFLARFLKIRILKNTRTPIHDHVRKNLNWSNTQTVFRFAVVQALISAVVLWLVQ